MLESKNAKKKDAENTSDAYDHQKALKQKHSQMKSLPNSIPTLSAGGNAAVRKGRNGIVLLTHDGQKVNDKLALFKGTSTYGDSYPNA